ncbi:MFS transporter [Vulcanimicrobium alpinum]|uniref:MFS transporter n=1 Tax=Vulcanimicrobium alpinum TaxID=3016050 RepID=A0AAN1Y0P1_UNVUL|nr:MFS transporter [Vulcanimicrobium alpinum]BDE08258.1 MFS transporter [Vulcanimicrobium alpinum]
MKVSPFVWLCGVGFLGRLSYEMIRTPIVSLFAVRLGAPTQIIGLLVAAVTLTGIVVKYPSGALADIFGFRRIMSYGLIVKATAPFLYMLVSTWPQLLVLRLYHGLSTALYAPVASAFVAKEYPEQRASRLGMYGAFENGGVVLGPVFGAYLLSVSSFTVAFLSSGIIGIMAFRGIFEIPRDARRTPEAARLRPADIARQMLAGAKEIASDGAIRIVSFVEGTMYMGVGTLQAFLPLYALSVHISVAEVGVLFGIQGAASIIGRPLWGKASDTTGRRPLVVAGIVLCAATLVTMPLTENFLMLCGLNLLFGLGTGMVTPSTTALIGDLVKRNAFGAAMGVFGSLWDIGHASGPIIAGFLIAWIGYRYAFSIIAVPMLLALVFFVSSNGVRRVADRLASKLP